METNGAGATRTTTITDQVAFNVRLDATRGELTFFTRRAGRIVFVKVVQR